MTKEAVTRAKERPSSPSSPPVALPTVRFAGSWANVFQGEGRERLASTLPGWLQQRRWFSGKAKEIQKVELLDIVPLDENSSPANVQLLFVQVEYDNADLETYLLPVGFAEGTRAEQVAGENPDAAFAWVELSEGEQTAHGVLYDAFGDELLGQRMLELIGGNGRLRGSSGEITGHALACFAKLRGSRQTHLPVRALKVEQSNSTIIYGDRLLLKLFRRLDRGVNLDLEIGRFLTESGRFRHTPQVAGHVDFADVSGNHSTVGILQAFVRNEGDAWKYTLEQVRGFFERVLASRRRTPPAAEDFPVGGILTAAANPIPPLVHQMCGDYLKSAALLGQRTAELHLALSASGTDDFAPEPFTEAYQRSLYDGYCRLARKTLDTLRAKFEKLPPVVQQQANTLFEREQGLMDRFRVILNRDFLGYRIRCHGDYHLGQVLYTGEDFLIIDFEGEPARPLSERRIKRTPLVDVAGMIRSLDYAAQTVFADPIAGMIDAAEHVHFQNWAQFWSQWISVPFVAAYLRTYEPEEAARPDSDEISILLDLCLLDKAVYELGYELNNRPTWVSVPLTGLLRILETKEK